MAGSVTAEQLLSTVDLFAGVPRRQLKKLVGLGRETEHRAGQALASEGLGALAFHLVLAGEASVHLDGKEVRRLQGGDYFGEISMIDGRPRSASVVAETPLRTFAINRTDFLALLDAEPSVGRSLLEGLCARLRAVEASAPSQA